MLCEDKFLEIYGRTPDGISFSPYRICPIGAHSDHNLGKITGLAIDKGIHFAYRPKQNGVVELARRDTMEKESCFDLGDKVLDQLESSAGQEHDILRSCAQGVG